MFGAQENMDDQILGIRIQPQQTQTSCGATCLQAIYQFWNADVDANQLAVEIKELAGGGVLSVELACNALRHGFDATIVTFNLQLFDPTWFRQDGRSVPKATLANKLRAQVSAKRGVKGVDFERLVVATDAYINFLELGGQLTTQPLELHLLSDAFDHGLPVLCGLSATYLYQESRERMALRDGNVVAISDDVSGEPQGHFVVLHGYNPERQTIHIADPLQPNAVTEDGHYEVEFTRLATAILLGIVTYDANLLILRPRSTRS